MTESISLDVHTHLVPIEEEALEHFNGVEWDSGRERLTIDGHTVGIKSLFKVEELIAWMNVNAIAKAWVSAPPPAYRMNLDSDEALGWSNYLNRGLASICARSDSRLEPLMHLPVEHPALALLIAREAVASGHSRFAMACGDGRQIVLSDAGYEPLWAELDRVSAFLLLHPPESHDTRLSEFYMHNLIGNPFETALALSHLVFAGVPERYPSIRFCLAHGGGFSCVAAGRLQRGFDTKRPGLDINREPPELALRRVFVDSIMHDPKALALAAAVFGEGNVVFGSDWPFPMGLPEPHTQLAGLDAGLRSSIFACNSQRLLESG